MGRFQGMDGVEAQGRKKDLTNKIFNVKITLMKILLLIMLTIIATLSVDAVEYDKGTIARLKEEGVYFGDPSSVTY